MWQNLCANINYYKISFKYVVLCLLLEIVREQSSKSDLVKIPVIYFPPKVFLSKVMSYLVFKLGSL